MPISHFEKCHTYGMRSRNWHVIRYVKIKIQTADAERNVRRE